MGNDTSKMRWMRYLLGSSGQQWWCQGKIRVLHCEENGWRMGGNTISRGNVNIFFSRTGQMFSCPAASLRKFCRTHFLFAGQNLSSGQISAFNSLPPVKKLFCRNSVLQIFFAGEQNRASVRRTDICSQDRFWRSLILTLSLCPDLNATIAVFSLD